jgi:hypothetical protein
MSMSIFCAPLADKFCSGDSGKIRECGLVALGNNPGFFGAIASTGVETRAKRLATVTARGNKTRTDNVNLENRLCFLNILAS